ncbi:DUF3786 domain-containing protein [Oscillospiraceae bacterium WX1]
MTEIINNKEGVPLGIYTERYKALNVSEVTARCGAPFDSARGAFVLCVYGNTLYAAWPEWALQPDDPATCPKALHSGPANILMIRFLLEGRDVPAAGQYLAYRELPWGEVYDKNFQGRCIKRLAFGFGSRIDAFKKGALALGGIESNRADASFDLPYIGDVVIRLTLWAGDDEFPPQSQWLFSDNTPQAFTAEDVAVVGDVLIEALKELSK